MLEAEYQSSKKGVMECSSKSGRTLKKADLLSIYFTSVSHFSYQLAEQLTNHSFPPSLTSRVPQH